MCEEAVTEGQIKKIKSLYWRITDKDIIKLIDYNTMTKYQAANLISILTPHEMHHKKK